MSINATEIETTIRSAGVKSLRNQQNRNTAEAALKPMFMSSGVMPIAVPDCAPKKALTSVGRYARWAERTIATALEIQRVRAIHAAMG